MNGSKDRQYECESKLIYSVIVAGKSANFADKAMRALMQEVAKLTGDTFTQEKDGYWTSRSPFEMLRDLTGLQISMCCHQARTGNYLKITRCIEGILAWSADLNFETCTPLDLEKIHGIGPKTSRFFIMWIRPKERYAALDVHVLRWLRNNGYPDAPKSTPSGEKYVKYEKIFIAEADKRGKTPRDLDYEIWMAGSGRAQETATP